MTEPGDQRVVVSDSLGFSPAKNRMVFFSRGRGHGHAIPDMAIVGELEKLRRDIEVRFVSYGTGAATLAQHGRPVVDLKMPDVNPLWETVVRAGSVVGQMRPDLVVSHEEFPAVPVANLFDIPVVFITDWFSDSDDLLMEALQFAEEIVFIDDEGVFEVPSFLEGKVYCTGPVLRPFNYSRSDQQRARSELGFPKDATIILVLPGGWATEEKEPIFDIVVPAFNSLKAPEKLLVWVAGADCEELTRRLGGRSGVVVKDHDWQMDRLMVAGDIAVTKANRRTIRELAALGIPSVSISHGQNPIDDMTIAHIPSNSALDARTVSPRMLAQCIVDAVHSPPVAEYGESLPGRDSSKAAARAAERLIYHLDKAKGRRKVKDFAATA